MTKKYLTFSAGIILLLLFGISGIESLNGKAQVAVAADEHSGQKTHGAINEHGSGSHVEDHSGGHGEHHAQETEMLTPEISWYGWLPVILTFFSVFTAFLVIAFHKNQKIKSFISVGTAVGSFGLILLMFKPVVTGITIHGHAYKGIFVTLPLFLGFDATFNVDPAALLVAGVTVFLWILSTIHWLSYKNVEDPKKHTRYETLVLASLAMNMGVLMAGDFLTLFFFFEGMVIFPYSLIAHKEDAGAIRGANMYLRLGSATSLILLFGILLLQHFTGTISIRPLGPEINALVPGAFKYIIAALMIIGFGGKAGIWFEHAWLPNAHPVAPTPASCLLSGAMIKAGAYGIFRVVNMVFIPPDWTNTLQWITARHIGYAVIWVGIVTMFFGVLNALIASNSKRMLAYHSVSQMGYIVMGMGCAAYLGADGAMGLAGSLYHIVNHALFKASLFLTVGAVYYRTHELDMYKLGGLWRNMPFTCVAMFIAACGIAGIPGFNGFASKTLLHHSILEAYEHSAHYSANGLPDFKLRIAEIIFMITAGGTFASNMKLWVLDFLGDRQEKHKDIKSAPTSMKVALGLVSASILFIGLNPNWMLETIIGPALAYFHFNPSSHPYHILYNTHVTEGLRSTIPILYNPVNFDFISNSEVVHNLLGGGDAVIFGGMTFILGMRFGWFHSEVPNWLSVVWYYKNIYHGFLRSCHTVFAKLDAVYGDFIDNLIYIRGIRAVVERTSREKGGAWKSFDTLDKFYAELVEKLIFADKVKSATNEGSGLSTAERTVWQEFKYLDQKYNKAFDKAIFGHRIKNLIKGGEEEEGKIFHEITQMEKKYGEAFDKAILGPRIKNLIKGGEGEEGKIWQEITQMEEKYGKAFDKAILGHRIRNLIKGGEEEEGKIWQEITQLEEKYGETFDRAIITQRIKSLIKGGEEEGKVWQELTHLEEKYGEAFDKLIFSRNVQDLIKKRAGGESSSASSRLWKRFSEFDSLFYDVGLDNFLFGNVDPSAKPEENRFFKFTRRLSNIHSGDIGRYISWIIILLAVVVAVLIGRLYFTTLADFLILVTGIIVLLIIAIFLS